MLLGPERLVGILKNNKSYVSFKSQKITTKHYKHPKWTGEKFLRSCYEQKEKNKTSSKMLDINVSFQPPWLKQSFDFAKIP